MYWPISKHRIVSNCSSLDPKSSSGCLELPPFLSQGDLRGVSGDGWVRDNLHRVDQVRRVQLSLPCACLGDHPFQQTNLRLSTLTVVREKDCLNYMQDLVFFSTG